MTDACSPRNGLSSEDTRGDIVDVLLLIVSPLLFLWSVLVLGLQMFQ